MGFKMFILSNPEPSLGVAKIHAYLMVQWGFDTIKLRKKCTFKSQIFFIYLINSHSKDPSVSEHPAYKE